MLAVEGMGRLLMFNHDAINEFIRQAGKLVPEEASGLKAEFQRNLQPLVQSAFAKMELVNREEFEIQQEALAEMRKRIDELEQQVHALTEQLQALGEER